MPDAARIFISVAEDSADVHAARLIRTARQFHPGWHFTGLTGPRMRTAGADTVADLTQHAAMLTKAASVIGRARQALAAAEQAWQTNRPDVVIVMDSSALHLRMAKRAQRHGLPVIYYIAPQTWASRAWRNRQIRKYVDHLACILPFEPGYFRKRGIDAKFVGHPLFETLADAAPDAATVERLRNEAPLVADPASPSTGAQAPLVAVLPGSRRHVIETMLPLQLDVARRIAAAGQPLRLAVSCVAADRESLVREHVERAGIAAEVVVADNASLLTAADVVLVASGTATLEVAHYRKPMIVMYDAGRLLHWLYRLLGRIGLTVPHLALVNILAGRRIVSEFMPFIRDPAAVATAAGQLLRDEVWQAQLRADLDEVVRPLAASQASRRVCALIERCLR